VPEGAHEDLELVRSCRAGNIQAFSGLVAKYQDRVFNLSYRLLGNFEEARDISQTAFIRAYESLGTFRGTSAFYTWLYRIVLNAALDARKARAHRQETSMDGMEELSGDARPHLADADCGDPAEQAVLREQHGRIVQAIHELDDDYRTVVLLRDVEGLDYSEIAEVTGLPAGTVKSRLHRARLVLRDRLKDMVS